MKKILLALATLYTLGQANGCLLIQEKSMNVDWKAYKTLGKIGVGGKFTDVTYTPTALEGKNFSELLVGSKVAINTSKIDTGNPARDETLVKFFFDQMTDKSITATIKEITADKRIKDKPRTGIVQVMIEMNKKSLLIPMKYSYVNENFEAKGVIDLFDFHANEALASINKSCFDLHKGKTWSDVSIGFNTKIQAKLCDINITK